MVMLQTKKLWHTIDYDKFRSSSDSDLEKVGCSPEFCDDLRAGLQLHGLVIINNINLQESEYMDLVAKTIGTPALELPNALVPSKLPGYPEIARVGNFKTTNATSSTTTTTPTDTCDDGVDPNYAFGHYWHHDGDFWPNGKNHICNFLHSKIVAQSGGQTGFISTTAAYDSLDNNTKEEIKNATVVVDPANIEDFRGIAPEDWSTSVIPAGGSVEHPIVQQKGKNKSLYLPFFVGTIKLSSGKEVSYDDLFNRLFHKKEVQYFHSWSENQLVVWDNLKTMHRAMGETKGRRLLWRAQGRIKD